MYDPEDREPEVGSDTGYEHTTGDRGDASDDCNDDLSDTRPETDDGGWVSVW